MNMHLGADLFECLIKDVQLFAAIILYIPIPDGFKFLPSYNTFL